MVSVFRCMPFAKMKSAKKKTHKLFLPPLQGCISGTKRNETQPPPPPKKEAKCKKQNKKQVPKTEFHRKKRKMKYFSTYFGCCCKILAEIKFNTTHTTIRIPQNLNIGMAPLQHRYMLFYRYNSLQLRHMSLRLRYISSHTCCAPVRIRCNFGAHLRHVAAQVKSRALQELRKCGLPAGAEPGTGWPALLAGWMHVNSIKAELSQFNQLQTQSAANVWRLNAFREVLAACADSAPGDGREGMQPAVQVFEETVSYSLSKTEYRTLLEPIEEAAAVHQVARPRARVLTDSLAHAPAHMRAFCAGGPRRAVGCQDPGARPDSHKHSGAKPPAPLAKHWTAGNRRRLATVGNGWLFRRLTPNRPGSTESRQRREDCEWAGACPAAASGCCPWGIERAVIRGGGGVPYDGTEPTRGSRRARTHHRPSDSRPPSTRHRTHARTQSRPPSHTHTLAHPQAHLRPEDHVVLQDIMAELRQRDEAQDEVCVAGPAVGQPRPSILKSPGGGGGAAPTRHAAPAPGGPSSLQRVPGFGP